MSRLSFVWTIGPHPVRTPCVCSRVPLAFVAGSLTTLTSRKDMMAQHQQELGSGWQSSTPKTSPIGLPQHSKQRNWSHTPYTNACICAHTHTCKNTLILQHTQPYTHKQAQTSDGHMLEDKLERIKVSKRILESYRMCGLHLQPSHRGNSCEVMAIVSNFHSNLSENTWHCK